MRTKIFFNLVIIALICSACSDWLDVSPKTQVKEKDLFQKEEGFKSALTGIYTKMATQDLYGAQMTYDFMEKLVQRYDNYAPGSSADEQRGRIYDYDENNYSKSQLASIWRNQYNTIANINNLLRNLEIEKAVIEKSPLFPYIKGEALALRAYIHFDLLRMWGPVYSEKPMLKSIVWRDELTADKTPLMEADKVSEKIIADLKAAEELLKGDRMEWGYNILETPFLRYRRYRMNKFAVKGLLARVYLWIGDKANAYAYADDVIKNSGLSLVVDNRTDPSMFKEHLFSLDIHNQEEKLRQIFPNTASGLGSSPPASVLWISKENAERIFETQSIGLNDVRYKEKQGFLLGSNRMLLRKYMTLNEATTSNNRPLIRLSEMFYIRAETGTLEQSVNDINRVRNIRGIRSADNIVANNDYTEQERTNHLNKEYQKEYFGEGQWFFFLKRTNQETFYRNPMEDGFRNYYVPPIPTGEIEHGLGSRDD